MPKDTTTTTPLLSLDQAQIILSEGKTAAAEKDYDKAIELFGKAIEIFEVHEEWEAFMEASYELAKTYRKEFLFSELNKVVDFSLKIQEQKCPDLFIWKVKLCKEKGDGLYEEGKFREAIQCFNEAQCTMEKEQLLGHLLIHSILYQVVPYIMISNYLKAEELLNTVSELLKKEEKVEGDLMAEFYYTKGIVESKLFKYELAKQSYQKAYELYSSQQMDKKIHCYLKVSEMQGIAKKPEEKIKNYSEVFDAYKNSNNKRDKFSLAKIYIEFGRYNAGLGELTQSLYFYENALTLFDEISNKLEYMKFSCMKLISAMLRRSRFYLEEIDCYQKQIKIGKKIFNGSNIQIGSIYFNLANAYINTDNLDKALEFSQKASAIYRELLDEKHDFIIDGDYLIGRIHTEKREPVEGLRYLKKVLNAYKEKYADNYYSGYIYRKIAEFYNHIATNFHEQGNLKKALENRQLAIKTLLLNYEETDFYDLPTLEQCPPTEFNYLCNLLFEKTKDLRAYFYILKAEDSIAATKVLKAGLNTCELMIDYLFEVQKGLVTPESKLSFTQGLIDSYQLSIEISLLLNSHLEDDSIIQKAFDFHEQTKGLLLRSAIQENKAKLQVAIDTNLLEQEKNLKKDIEALLRKIQQEKAKGNQKDKIKLKNWREEYLQHLQSHQNFIEQLEKDSPKYYQLKHNLQTVSITTLQKDLGEDTVVISYLIGSEKGYIFALTSDEYEVIPFDIPSNFDQQIQGYLNSIQTQNITDFIPQSHALYFLLIEPISYLVFDPFAGTPKNVVILPSAALNYLPFETLIREIPHTAQPAFHQLDYLLQHCQIQYHYSATLYHQSLTKKEQELLSLPSMKKANSIDFLGFAPIYTSDKAATQEALRGLAEDYSRWATRSDALRDGTLAPLPFSEKEVENIEGLFTQKGLKGQSLLYDTATKDHFKTLAANAKYLHIAAHGLTNDEYPKLSGIVFHPDEKATEIHDSVLSMGEMYQLQLQADLVVLSSCESGIGKLAKGEGMMAINRGFLYAGAKNVIYTLFKVLDKPSSELCEALFEEILEGKTYSEALRLAKLRLIQRADVDPKSWSGFVLLGA
ncbi:MAG: CHAT domain-containing protein [Chitinophagales bacterium]